MRPRRCMLVRAPPNCPETTSGRESAPSHMPAAPSPDRQGSNPAAIGAARTGCMHGPSLVRRLRATGSAACLAPFPQRDQNAFALPAHRRSVREEWTWNASRWNSTSSSSGRDRRGSPPRSGCGSSVPSAGRTFRSASSRRAPRSAPTSCPVRCWSRARWMSCSPIGRTAAHRSTPLRARIGFSS